jgi:hypothetical protein
MGVRAPEKLGVKHPGELHIGDIPGISSDFFRSIHLRDRFANHPQLFHANLRHEAVPYRLGIPERWTWILFREIPPLNESAKKATFLDDFSYTI